ncbi:UNVERIFIED_CONTAM: hypothetical protein FKN15_028113 [Acipenser sinensis]
MRDRQPQAVRDRQPQAVRDRARAVPQKVKPREEPQAKRAAVGAPLLPLVMELGPVLVLGLATLAVAAVLLALFAAGLFSAMLPSADYAVAAEEYHHHILVLPHVVEVGAAGSPPMAVEVEAANSLPLVVEVDTTGRFPQSDSSPTSYLPRVAETDTTVHFLRHPWAVRLWHPRLLHSMGPQSDSRLAHDFCLVVEVGAAGCLSLVVKMGAADSLPMVVEVDTTGHLPQLDSSPASCFPSVEDIGLQAISLLWWRWELHVASWRRRQERHAVFPWRRRWKQ